MGAEFTAGTLEGMCDLMCDNVVPEKLCDTCIYRNNVEQLKPCIIYRDDCEYYEREEDMKAIIQIDVPNYQIGQEVSIYFKDTMMIKGIVQEPCGETVSLEAFKQVMWERDIAIEQLKELGYGFGQKIEPKTIQEKQAESEKYQKAFDDGYENGYAQARFDYEQEPKTGYISIDDAMSAFDDFMCGEVDEDGTDTFLEMLKDRVERENEE